MTTEKHFFFFPFLFEYLNNERKKKLYASIHNKQKTLKGEQLILLERKECLVANGN